MTRLMTRPSSRSAAPTRRPRCGAPHPDRPVPEVGPESVVLGLWLGRHARLYADLLWTVDQALATRRTTDSR